MSGLLGKALPAFMIAAFAATAHAQKACDLDEGTPAQVARARLDLQLAQSAGKPEDALPKLKDAVKLLSEGDMTKNPTGRAYVLGQTLVLLMGQPTMATGMSTRGGVGLVSDPSAPFDIIAAVDSTFNVVETAFPECTATTAPWRQQKGWVDLINKAIELSNAGKNDSAAYYAKRSIQLSRNAPYGYMILGQTAVAAKQPKEAITNYQLAIAAAKDTAQADQRRQMLQTLGNYTADQAEAATGADKTEFMNASKAAFAELAKDPGTKYADAAHLGQARLASISGDTAAIKNSYADQLANPSAFSYSSLMNAAVTAARADQTKDAIKLFEAARLINPYHRDVLYNLARLYVVDSSYVLGIPAARQLIAVDPSNPDDYSLIALAYANVKKGYDIKTKAFEAKAKALGAKANTVKGSALKAVIDSAARMTPIIKAYNDSAKVAVDSALRYNDLMLHLPAKVVFSQFSAEADKATAGGTLANLGEASRSFTLKVEFIDKTGAVVSAQEVPVGPVAPHSSVPFTAAGTGAGIVAFRYAPLT
jgi:predicted Zn-dependent protease